MKAFRIILTGFLAVVLIGCSSVEEQEVVDIAVIDTGVSTHLKEFGAFNIEQNAVAPSSPHGTMVLSVILGVAQDQVPLPPSRVNVFSYDVGENPDATHLAQAIAQAVERKVDLISISLGTRQNNPDLEAAIELAEQQGITVLAASGNVRFLQPDYPARYNSVVSVAALTESGSVWDQSATRGVDTAAQGVNVSVITQAGAGSHASGTSFATAIIAHDLLEALISGDIQEASEYSFRSLNYGS